MPNTHSPHLCCSLHFQQQIDGAYLLSLTISLSTNVFSAPLTNQFGSDNYKCRFAFAYSGSKKIRKKSHCTKFPLFHRFADKIHCHCGCSGGLLRFSYDFAFSPIEVLMLLLLVVILRFPPFFLLYCWLRVLFLLFLWVSISCIRVVFLCFRVFLYFSWFYMLSGGTFLLSLIALTILTNFDRNLETERKGLN